MRSARAAAALACACGCALITGCGGIRASDLFVVTRSGSGPHAHLRLVVNEEGGVSCNGTRTAHLSDSQLVKARAIQEELQNDSSRHLTLPPRPGSVLSYFLRDESGWVRFSDNSRSQPKAMRELQLLVLTTAQQDCHLPE